MSLMTLPRRSIWPAPSRRSIWPGRYGAGQTVQSIDNLIASLSGALYSPDTSNCWRDAGRTTPCTYDTKVYLMDDTTGAFTASQPTSTSQPYLRSGNYSDLPFTSDTGETWATTRTMIDAAGGIEWSGSDAYWRNSAGTIGQYASTPDSVAASITGDLTMIVKITRANGVAEQDCIIGKYNTTGNNRSYRLIVSSTDKLLLATTSDGSTVQIGQTTNTVDFTAGKYFTATLDVNDGSGNRVYTFKQSSDGINWTTLESSGTVSGTTSIYDGTSVVEIGAYNLGAAELFTGKIHYAAAWANTTGSGTPAWEFYPARDAVKPASPWLDFDGTNDYLISSIIPGNYSEGFICVGALQTEAIGSPNSLFGSSSSDAVKGVRASVSAIGTTLVARYDGTTNTSTVTTETVTASVLFAFSGVYAVASASAQINAGTKATSAVTRNYTGSTQYALIGATNSVESGVTPSNYLQGHIHALAWLPSIPTEAQETAIRSYIAGKAGVTL